MKIKIAKEIWVLGMIFLAVAGLSATARADDLPRPAEACIYGGAGGFVASGVEGFAERRAPTPLRTAAWVGAGCGLGMAMSVADSYAAEAPSENDLKQDEPANNQE